MVKKFHPQTVSASISRGRHAAFTLAEVLITLAIIGIVAALTIPALVQNHNEKAWSTAQDLFTKKLEVAMRVLNTQEKLTGYENTTDFVNELKKNIKITKVCAPDKVTECFAKEIYWRDTAEPLSLENGAEITLADDTVLDDVVGVQFANGTTALMAYMKDRCTQDPYNNTFGATSSCLAVVYDISGYKKPNRYVNTENKFSDIGAINVKQLNGVAGCVLKLADADGKDFCISQILGAQNGGYTYLTYADCTQAKTDGKIDVDACYPGDDPGDYYAGAVLACGGKKDNLPNQGQLLALAKYVFGNDSISSSAPTAGVSFKDDRAQAFLTASPEGSGTPPGFGVWSSTETDSTTAYARLFFIGATYWYNLNRYVIGGLAVCLGD